MDSRGEVEGACEASELHVHPAHPATGSMVMQGDFLAYTKGYPCNQA